MFERDHHNRIATILQSLDAKLLKENHCLFGGGTAIVLLHGEYRESIDIDFLVSDPAGYKNLRNLTTGDAGINSLVREGMSLKTTREIRVDQYGIRTLLQMAGTAIKFEIVSEGRIRFDDPGPKDQVCGISTLTVLDMAASKILANSDRWSDDGVFSRDLIDLAMLDLPRPTFKRALEKAEQAYGASAERDLTRAIQALQDRKDRLEECLTALQMDEIPKAVVWKRIRDLKSFTK